jgi:hypothetical protein
VHNKKNGYKKNKKFDFFKSVEKVAKKLHKVHSVKQFFSLILKVNKNENGSDFEFGTISLLRIIMRFLRKLFLI